MKKAFKIVLSLILITWIFDHPLYLTHSPSLIQEYLLNKLVSFDYTGIEQTSLGLFTGISNGFKLVVATIPIAIFRAILDYITGFEGGVNPFIWMFLGIFWTLLVNLFTTMIAYVCFFVISLLTFTNPLFYVGSFLGVYLGLKLLVWLFSTSKATDYSSSAPVAEEPSTN